MSNNKNSLGGVVLIAILILIFLVVIITPVILFLGYVYYEYFVWKKKKTLGGSPSDFWLDEVEKIRFKKELVQLVEAENMLKNAYSEANAAGISKNKDGTYSKRSHLGKKVSSIIRNYSSKKNCLSRSINEMVLKPERSWSDFNSLVIKSRSFLWSLIIWFCSLLIYGNLIGRESLYEIISPYLGLVVNIFREAENQLPSVEGGFVMVLIVTAISIASYFLLLKFLKYPAIKYSPIPPRVSVENIDMY